MKKIFFAIILILSAFTAKAQSIFDFPGLTTPTINGTARYMSMGGSFGALGGDVSAITDNPATLGIFRSNELNFSTNLQYTTTKSDWGGISLTDNRTKFNINNLSWVTYFPSYNESGYLNSNFSFSFNKLKSFNRRAVFKHNALDNSLSDLMVDITNGLYETDLEKLPDAYSNNKVAYLSILGYHGYLINPTTTGGNQWASGVIGVPAASYRLNEWGYLNDYNFTYSGNVNDVFYFGIGVSLQDYYRVTQTYYGEVFSNGNFDLTTTTLQNGSGINFNFGLIARLSPNVRLGASLKTPTSFSFTNKQFTTLTSDIAAAGRKMVITVPDDKKGIWDYDYTSPLKAQFSAGFIVASNAAINIDYVLTDNKTQKFKLDGDANPFKNENIDFKQYSQLTHTIKVGVEAKVTSNVKLRGGFAYITSPMSAEAKKNILNNTIQTDMEYFIDNTQLYGTCGIGFNFNNIFLDFAYVYNRQNQIFTPFEMYKNTIKGDITNNYHNIVATIAIKY